MRIRYAVNTGLVGGLQLHVKCLMEELWGAAETAVAINAEKFLMRQDYGKSDARAAFLPDGCFRVNWFKPLRRTK